jgi:hypothetical protein
VAERSKARVYGLSLAGLRFRILLGASISLSCECCLLSGGGPREGPIPRPEESYRLWCVIVCDLDTSSMRRPWPALGCCPRNKQINISEGKFNDYLQQNPR